VHGAFSDFDRRRGAEELTQLWTRRFGGHWALATPNGNWTDAFRAAEAASVAEAEPNPCCRDDVRETLLWLVAA